MPSRKPIYWNGSSFQEMASPEALGLPVIPFASLPTLGANDRALAWATGTSRGNVLMAWNGTIWVPESANSIPVPGSYTVGQYYDSSISSGATGNQTGAANQLELAPFITDRTVTIDRLGAAVSTGVAGSLFRVLIYNSDSNGWPDVLQSVSVDLNAATSNTFLEETRNFTFVKNTVYWLGIWKSSTASFRTVPLGNSLNLGLVSGGATSYSAILRRIVTFNAGNSANVPNPWVFSAAEKVGGIAPVSVRFRVA